jgi:hypothetical protein
LTLFSFYLYQLLELLTRPYYYLLKDEGEAGMEHRSEPRVEHQVRFFFEVYECPEDLDLVGTSIECEAIDFSSHGIQLQTDQKVPANTMLNITIGVGDPFAMYLLRGEVRWVRTPTEDICLMGVLMREAEGTDLEKWADQFDQTFNS